MMDLHEAAQALHAGLSGANVTFTSVRSDSRAVSAGDLFIALVGDKFDGHQFVAEAGKKGAVAAMINQDSELRTEDSGIPLLAVKDTRSSLGRLSGYWRGKFDIPLVAVTGSNGKTTVKELLAAILREHCASTQSSSPHPFPLSPGERGGGEGLLDPRSRVLATSGNLNNDIGVPLMLLQLRSQHRYAVIEMGMNHAGEIAYLTGLARPDVAVINNAAPAHIEFFPSVEAIARAKGEIFQSLGPDGSAVINADDAFAPLWRDLAKGRRIVEFGLNPGANVTAQYRLFAAGAQLRVRTPSGDTDVRLQVLGIHNVRNALAAAACAVALGIPNDAVARGLGVFAGMKGRLQRTPCLHGATLIDDTYNANPESVKAALAVLAVAGGKKVLVLGDMGELGARGVTLHQEIGEQARRAGIDALFTLGKLSAHAAGKFGTDGRHFERIEDLLAEVENLLAPDVTVLVKGSRFMQMERVVKSFEL